MNRFACTILAALMGAMAFWPMLAQAARVMG